MRQLGRSYLVRPTEAFRKKSELRHGALIAFFQMSAQIGGAAAQNIVNHLILVPAHGVLFPITPDMAAEDIGQLNFGLIHGHHPPRGIWGYQ